MVVCARLRSSVVGLLLGAACLLAAGCGDGASTNDDAGVDTSGQAGTGGGAGTVGSAGTTGTAGRGGTTGTAGRGGTTGSAGRGGSSGGGGQGGGTTTLPANWLFTSGNKVHVSDGNGGGPVWMGRGVNVDDVFFCGYNTTLWMTSPEQTAATMVNGLVSGWKPNFIRTSLSMDSFDPTVSWLGNAAQYKTPMTTLINGIIAHPGVYVLVSLRSDASMIGQDNTHGDPEATGIPSDSTTTPDRNAFPNGTDPVYVALVDSFANSPYVLFGLTNEPGGNLLSNNTIAAAMRHAVDTIRAEEDRLGVPHHIISVQGQGWTSDISFFATTPIARDNIVYEVHGYPPSTSSYTYANLPVIIGEYGSLSTSNASAFFNDLETKQIPNLAWDFDPFSNCAPDLVNVTTSATSLMPTAWGMIVQPYLTSHAP